MNRAVAFSCQLEQKCNNHHKTAMPRFHVKNTFEIPARKLFVMAGTILDGKIQVGMFIRITCNSALGMTARIHSIEFARRKDGEDVCLCIEAEPELAEMLRGLNIADETVEITTIGAD